MYELMQNPIVQTAAGVLFMFYILFRLGTVGEFEERSVDSKKSGAGYIDWRYVYMNPKFVISFLVFFGAGAYILSLGFVLCQIIFFYIKV